MPRGELYDNKQINIQNNCCNFGFL